MNTNEQQNTPPTERPTPIADASLAKMKLSGYGGLVELHVARDLERQLADARESKERILKRAESIRCELVEALQKIERQAERIRYLEGATNHATGTPLAKMTEERDRLVEAIRKHKATFPDEVCDGERDLWSALDSLTPFPPCDTQMQNETSSHTQDV